jgi:hypothetical protein
VSVTSARSTKTCRLLAALSGIAKSLPHEVADVRPRNVGRSAASGGIPGLDLAGPAYLLGMSCLLPLDSDSSLAE